MKVRWPAVVVAGCLLLGPASSAAAEETGWNPDTGIYEMFFPVDDPHSYSDSWGACRDGCTRFHEGTDIFAPKMTLVFAAADGTVGWMDDTQGGDCCAMALEHDDGWVTRYIHLNNDTPGTDDGLGWGFAPGITSGVHVEAGEWIAWVGDSGNAESTSAHVHFELHRPDGTKTNPYPHLVAAEQPEGSMPGVVSFDSFRVVDGPAHDGTGNDSRGNNNGIAECGEIIELYATVTNDGEGTLTNLAATLDVSDPFITRLYNRRLSYAPIDPGESGENPRDWDLRIASDVPGGHHFMVTLTYTASFGGPWIIDVAIPISCGEDVTPPEVTTRSPHHGEFAVAVDSVVTVEFNEPLDPLSVTADSFALEDGTPVTGLITVGADAMSASFDPDADLEADTVYKVLLGEQITDVTGNPLLPTAWTFSTGDITPGSVVDISYRIDDGPEHDGTGDDSRGNNDSAAQCGEIIEIYVTARNEGDIVLSGLSGAFSESDPYVRLLYNINAPYPDLSPGASGENLSDWDIKINRDTPVGYVFTATITFSLLDPIELSLNPIDSEVDVEIPIECAAPVVTGFSPPDGAPDVFVGSDIRVDFSKPIDTATVTVDTFKVENGGPVPGTLTVAANRRSATFSPDADFDHETEYTVTVTDAIADKAGNPIDPAAATLTTVEPDTTSPEVTAVDPPDGSADVAIVTEVVVTFSEPIDSATVDFGSFTVGDGGPVAGSVAVAGDGLSATFTPDAGLAYQTLYAVSVDASVEDPSGNPLVAFDSAFTTAAAPPDAGVPVFDTYRVDDGPSHDGTGNDSRGNNDGIAQCGETIELYVSVLNDGDLPLIGVSALLLESDPHVSLLYNSTASYPPLGSGVVAENPRDWDLRISGSAPDGHDFEFTLRFTAAEGGPWDVDVSLPLACGGPPDPSDPGEPVLVSYRIDDGPGHDGTGNDSKGNDDGVAQCGETIELYLTLGNDGEEALTGLSALLLESDVFVSLLYNSAAAYPTIGPGASRENQRDWDLSVSPNAPGGHEFAFTLRVTADGGGPWDLDVSIPLDCGDPPEPEDPGVPVLVDIRVDDGPGHDGTGNDSTGNNDGVAQCGETIELYVTLRNNGAVTLSDVSGLFIEDDPHLTLLYNTSAGYPDLAPAAAAENPRDWDLRVAPDAPDGHEFAFTVRVTDGDGSSWDIDAAVTISCP